MNNPAQACASEAFSAIGMVLTQYAITVAVFKTASFICAAVGLAWMGWILGLLIAAMLYLSGAIFQMSLSSGRFFRTLYNGFIDGFKGRPAAPQSEAV